MNVYGENAEVSRKKLCTEIRKIFYVQMRRAFQYIQRIV